MRSSSYNITGSVTVGALTLGLLAFFGMPISLRAQEVNNEWSRMISTEAGNTGLEESVSLEWQRPSDYAYRTKQLNSRIRLQVDPYARMLLRPFDMEVRMEVRVRRNEDPDRYVERRDQDSVFVRTLRIGYRWPTDTAGLARTLDDQPYDDIYLTGIHALEVKLMEVTMNNGDGLVSLDDLPGGVQLEMRLQHEHVVVFDRNRSLDVNATVLECGGVPRELALSWDLVAGAEYQLEWAYVDDYPISILDAPLLPEDLEVDFRKNSTRVSTNVPSFRIPLIFDSGYLVYRVRQVTLDQFFPGSISYGAWTLDDVPDLSSLTSGIYHITHPHQNGKNWQLNATYAEEGKHKEVIVYADGSLRSRQMVTRNNSLDIPLIAETVYDVVGRPTLDFLPVPMIKEQGCDAYYGSPWAPIDYYPGFNVTDVDGAPEEVHSYTFSDISGGDGCGISARPAIDDDGAALYYSPAQLLLQNSLIEKHSFLPKANGYPFIQKEYTRDITGRLKRTGNAGEEFQLGNGHETTIFYGAPDQIHLDRMFGADAGYRDHYQKNTSIDPNGQGSVSYVDRLGRTVATALVGPPPGMVEELRSFTDLAPEIHHDELYCPPGPSYACTGNSYDPLTGTLTYSHGFVVPVDGRTYTFDYSILPPDLQLDCPEEICYHCVYELDLVLEDGCGGVIILFEGVIGQFEMVPGPGEESQFQVVFQACPSPLVDPGPWSVPLSKGEYDLVRTLRIHDEAREQYRDIYLDQAISECDAHDLDWFTQSHLDLTIDDCDEVTCAECYEAIGSLNEFLLGQKGDEITYEMLLEQCDELCEQPSWCDIAYDQMVKDMYPQGQYARYVMQNGKAVALEPVSIFWNDLENAGYDHTHPSYLGYRFFTPPVNPTSWYNWSWSTNNSIIAQHLSLWNQPRFVTEDGSIVPEYRNSNGIRSTIKLQLVQGSYTPRVINTNEPFVWIDDQGEIWTYPENLRYSIDLIDRWEDGWERSLVTYHPEYAYYLQCKQFKVKPYFADQSSEEFDQWLRSLAFEDAGDIIADPGSILELDPFVSNIILPSFSPYGQEAIDFLEVFNVYAADADNDPTYSMVEVASALGTGLQMCETAPFDPSCLSDLLSSEGKWDRFKSIYLAEKYKYQKRRADRILLMNSGEDGGVNFCIGCDDWNEWAYRMYDIDWGTAEAIYGPYYDSPMHRPSQPCSYWMHQWLASKTKRFADPEHLPMGTDPQQVAYQHFLQSGQCPMTVAWKELFRYMVEQQLLVGTFEDIGATTQFQAILLAEEGYQLPPPTADLDWDGSISGTGDLDVQITGDDVECGITLFKPDGWTGTFEWESILSITHIVALEGNQFELHAIYLEQYLYEEPQQIPVILTGTMCDLYLLSPCNFPPVCEPNEISSGLHGLMAILANSYSLGDEVDLSLAVAGEGSNQIIPQEQLTNALSALLGPGNLNWSYDEVLNQFLLRNLSTNATLVIGINGVSGGIVLPDDIGLVKSLGAFNSTGENTFTLELRDDQGNVLGIIQGSIGLDDDGNGNTALHFVSTGECGLGDPYGCDGNGDEVLADLFALFKGRLLAQGTPGPIELFTGSPGMSSLVQQYLEPFYCVEEIIEIDEIYLAPPPCGAVSDQPVLEDGVWTYEFPEECFVLTVPDVAFDDVIDPRAYGPKDDFGYQHAFTAKLMYQGNEVGQLLVEHPCIQLLFCEDCCDEEILPDFLSTMEWLIKGMVTEDYNQSTAPDIYTCPTLSPLTAELLQQYLFDEDPSSDYESQPYQFHEHGADAYFFRNVDGGDIGLEIRMPRLQNHSDLVFGAWEIYEGVYPGTLVLRSPLQYEETSYWSPVNPNSPFYPNDAHLGYAIIIPRELPLPYCESEPAAPLCISSEHALRIRELARVVYERIQHNHFLDPDDWLSIPIDLFASPYMTDELIQLLGAFACGTCSGGFASTSTLDGSELNIYPVGGDPNDPYLTLVSAFWNAPTSEWLYEPWNAPQPLPNNYISVLDLPVDNNYQTPYPIVRIRGGSSIDQSSTSYGLAWTANCFDLMGCNVLSPFDLVSDPGTVIPTPSIGCVSLYDLQCQTPPTDCDTEAGLLPDLVQQVNDIAGLQNINMEITLWNECDLVNEYLCPCVPGYAALLTRILEDGELDASEIADPGVWCIYAFCEMPQTCSYPIPVELEPWTVVMPEECQESAEVNAGMNAQTEYALQIQILTEDFEAAYNEACSKPLEVLSKSFEGRDEHHFTLYYYDQAGNLVRTVPPEGFEPVGADPLLDPAGITSSTDPIAQQIATDRLEDTRTVFTQHRLVTDMAYNSLGQLVKQKMPDQDPMEIFDMKEPNGIPSNLRITSMQLLPTGVGYLTGKWPTPYFYTGSTVLERGAVFKTVDGGNTWQRSWQTVGVDINSVASPATTSPNVFYAAGDKGTLLRSSDGGMSWDDITFTRSYFTEDLSDIVVWPVSSSTYGLAVGMNRSYRLMTSNGLFYAAPSTQSGDISDFTAVNYVPSVNLCYASAYAADGVHGILGRRSGGAISPSTQFTLRSEFRNSADINCGSPYLSNAYLAGDHGLLLKGIDLANSTASNVKWSTVRTGTTDDFLAIVFLSDQHGMAILRSPVSGVGIIHHTHDGGHTWNAISDPADDYRDLFLYHQESSPIQAAHAVAVGNDNVVAWVGFTEEGTAAILPLEGPTGTNDLSAVWAFIEDVTEEVFVLAADDAGNIHSSENLLASTLQWTTSNAAASAIKDVVGHHFSGAGGDQMNAVVVTGTGTGHLGTKPYGSSPWSWSSITSSSLVNAIKENDATGTVLFLEGDHFARLVLEAETPSTTLIQLSGNHGAASNINTLIQVGSGNHYFIGGNTGAIQRGTISGSSVTWTDRSRAIKPLPILHLVNGKQRAVGAQGYLFQIDPGSSDDLDWVAIPTRIVSDLSGADTYGSPEQAIVVGSDGRAYSGAWGQPDNWTEIALPVAVPLNEVLVSDVNGIFEAVIAGDDGYLFRCEDLTDPTFMASNSGGDIFGLARKNSAEAVIAVGEDCLVHQISGAGRLENQRIYSAALNDVHFVDALNGFAVGDFMSISRTTNGGATWEKIATDETLITNIVKLNAVHTYAPGEAYAVGARGKVKLIVDGQIINNGFTTQPSTTHVFNDVEVSDNGSVLLIGEVNASPPRGIWYKRVAGTWSGSDQPSNGTTHPPFKKIHAWPVQDDREDYLIGTASNGTSSKLFLVTRPADATSAFSLLSASPEVQPFTEDHDVTAIHFHDRTNGLVALNGGGLLRITAPADHGISGWGFADLSTSGAFPDAIDQQDQIDKITIRSIQFLDRNQGFLGGIYAENDLNVDPKRYARVVNDEAGLYSQRMWYDRLGRLVLSQNVKQLNASPDRFSYTLYDDLGRVVESGEKEEDPSMPFGSIFGTTVSHLFRSNVIDDAALLAFIESAGPRTEVTRTQYDVPLYDPNLQNDIADQFLTGAQENLRLRVVSTMFYEGYDPNYPEAYDHATHYSYDIHGNVKELVQENPLMEVDAGEVAQRYKHISYKYDLVSGNVHEVHYQKKEVDQFHHKYSYDADNRIYRVQTSRHLLMDPADYHVDADYFYYPHGPLARVELGEPKVQGIDHAYTLQGWLKGINSSVLQPEADMGSDALAGTLTADIGRDAFGMSIHYYDHVVTATGAQVRDYEPIDPDRHWDHTTDVMTLPFPKGHLATEADPLYNGNISGLSRSLQPQEGWYDVPNQWDPRPASVLGWRFKYDQLNRLVLGTTPMDLDGDLNEWATQSIADRYKSRYVYDANGNILEAQRHDQFGVQYDALKYFYDTDQDADHDHSTHQEGRLVRNRLYQLQDLADEFDTEVTLLGDGVEDLKYDITSFYDGGITGDPNQTHVANENRYRYDELGNLITDRGAEIDLIEWTTRGKVRSVLRDGTTFKELGFGYGAHGHRIHKTVAGDLDDGLTLQHRDHYVHDAQGNVMAIYRYVLGVGEEPLSFKIMERPIYGNRRLGIDRFEHELIPGGTLINGTNLDPEHIHYELTDHLANVAAVITGVRIPVDIDGDSNVDEYHADVVSLQDYEPFGSLLPERNYTSDSYRFAFQGQEKDDEILGLGSGYSFEARVYDSRVARWWSVDPQSQLQAGWSVYKAYYNNPVIFIDPNGQTEYKFYIRSFAPVGTFIGTQVQDDRRTKYSAEVASARVHNTWILDTETGQIGEFALNGQDTHFDPPIDGFGPQVFPAKENLYRGYKSAVTQRHFPGERNLLTFKTSYSAGNGITGDVFPEIDVVSSFWIQEDMKNNTLRISWTFGTDDFPATEGVIEDPSGQKILIGWAPADGHPTVTLTGAVDSFYQYNLVITTDDQGNFLSVQMLGSEKIYSIEEWKSYVESQCTNCDNQTPPEVQSRAREIISDP